MKSSDINGTGFLIRMTTDKDWSDLKLAPRVMSGLEDLRTAIKKSRKATDFAADFSAGAIALFSGPSGTGKTLAANVLATSLGLNAYRVDLSKVIAKYIGETEQNLDRIFETAEAQKGILFFDEADGLFGRRSDVSSSQGRYANQEVSYLLQQIEGFNGFVIFSTKLRDHVDPAFQRRFRYVIDFA